VNKTEVLERAAELVTGDREKSYGNVHTNYSRIAELWSVVLGYALDDYQVALCLAQLKVARLIETPTHEDSWIDGAGYLAIGAELATEDPLAQSHGGEVPTTDWEVGFLSNPEPVRVGDKLSTAEDYERCPLGTRVTYYWKVGSRPTTGGSKYTKGEDGWFDWTSPRRKCPSAQMALSGGWYRTVTHVPEVS